MTLPVSLKSWYSWAFVDRKSSDLAGWLTPLLVLYLIKPDIKYVSVAAVEGLQQ